MKWIKKVLIEVWQRFLWTAKCIVYKDGSNWKLYERALRLPTRPIFRWRWYGKDEHWYDWYVDTPKKRSERDPSIYEIVDELLKKRPIIRSVEVVSEYKSLVIGKNRTGHKAQSTENINLKDFFEEPPCPISEYPDEIEIIYVGYKNGMLYYHTPYFEEFAVKYRKVVDAPLLEKEHGNK